jgi:hypothetical protein
MERLNLLLDSARPCPKPVPDDLQKTFNRMNAVKV